MEGSLGRQLNTERSIDIEKLVEKTTVLEIRTIESSAQKVVTLSLLTQIFDYFKALGPVQAEKPRCIIVLDEAESVFSSAEVFGNDVEMVTAAYNAVQKLNQILRQGRSYGLAVVIATQSPTNISDEIIANTENKIIHRLHHGKDKRTIQEAMELTKTQTSKLSALKPGESYAIDGENQFPYFLKVKKPPIKELSISEKTKNHMMKKRMALFYHRNPWMKETTGKTDYSSSYASERSPTDSDSSSPRERRETDEFGLFDFDLEEERTEVDKAIEEMGRATEEERREKERKKGVEEEEELSKKTREQIDLLIKKPAFNKNFQRLIRDYYVRKINRITFYEELLDVLYGATIYVIDEQKGELRKAAMTILTKALNKGYFLDEKTKKEILERTRELIYIDNGGS